MKKLLILLILLPFSLSAQEKYFHELKGMEDSTATTHLFYRMFEQQSTTCGDFEGNTYSILNEENNIFHFNTNSNNDSLIFRDYMQITPGCDFVFYGVENFLFPTQSLDSTILIESTIGGLFGSYYISEGFEDSFELGLVNPLGISYDPFINKIILTTPIYELVIKTNRKTENYLKKSFYYTPNDTLWMVSNGYYDIPESSFINFTVAGVNPFFKGVYVGINDTSIVLSEDFGETYTPIAKSPFDIWDFGEYLKIESTFFDKDSSSFYMVFKTDFKKTVLLVKKETSEWSIAELSSNSEDYHFTINPSVSGSYYFSNEDSLFSASNFGETSDFMLLLPYQITGLYKKPNSEILYVLTTDELFEVNTESKDVTSLKKLPVSIEEPKEIPTSVTLHQNYPNPFNPSTTISFELDKHAEVTLTVFDALGRTIATLVNERKSTGLHTVNFDASNLSSGIYFYRLDAGEFSTTKRLTLIK